MSSDEDDRRALERYVAGVPVDPEALARAVTARAVDRTIVVEALLRGLDRDEPLLRRRMATRIAEMPHLDERVAARLRVLAGLDDDPGVREAAAEALRRHGVAAPGEVVVTSSAPAERTPLLASLRLRALVVRSAVAPVTLEARYREDAPDLSGRVVGDGHGGAIVELHALPDDLVGTRPLLRARRAPLPEPLAEIMRASDPVSAAGDVTFAVAASVASFDELVGWLVAGSDLLVPGTD